MNIDWSQLVTRSMKDQMAAEQLRATIVAQTAAYRAAADTAITPLQYAVDVDEATEEDVALLKLWKKYVIALAKLPQQAGYPATIEWPVFPV